MTDKIVEFQVPFFFTFKKFHFDKLIAFVYPINSLASFQRSLKSPYLHINYVLSLKIGNFDPLSPSCLINQMGFI